jgi:hypothetical protein
MLLCLVQENTKYFFMGYIFTPRPYRKSLYFSEVLLLKLCYLHFCMM